MPESVQKRLKREKLLSMKYPTSGFNTKVRRDRIIDNPHLYTSKKYISKSASPASNTNTGEKNMVGEDAKRTGENHVENLKSQKENHVKNLGGKNDKYIINIYLLYMTDVIIHIFQGIGTEHEEAFDEMKKAGIHQFKNYLLVVLGHVGISFGDENIYGFGPNITQHDLNELRSYYHKKRRSGRNSQKIPWNATNFLFGEKSIIFDGIISIDTEFFNQHNHVKIPLKLMGTKDDALEKLNSITAKYGIPPELLHRERTEEQRLMTFENCLSAIFNHLSLTYLDGRAVKPTLKQVYYLTQTLWDLVPSIRPPPLQLRPSASKDTRGGRRRKRKTKRKTRKKKIRKRKIRKRKSRKRKKN